MIARAVVELARVLGLDVVAEGVETAAQAGRLHALGYQHAQGFHFARPMPADEIDTLLSGTDRSDAAPGLAVVARGSVA